MHFESETSIRYTEFMFAGAERICSFASIRTTRRQHKRLLKAYIKRVRDGRRGQNGLRTGKPLPHKGPVIFNRTKHPAFVRNA